MTPRRPCNLSTPTGIVPSGSHGVQSNLTPQHGGKSSLTSLARMMSESLWEESGCHSSYPRCAAAPKEWPTTIQHPCPSLFGMRPISVLSRWEVWWTRLPKEAAPKDPGWCQGSPVLGGESPPADARHVSPTVREWTGVLNEPWNLWPHSWMQRFWMTACPATGSKSCPHGCWSLWIPQPLRNKTTAGAVGLRPEVHLQQAMA